jgi:hypothetical protein
MSFSQERVDIETRLNTGWVTTVIAWDNVPFVPTPGTSWIRCTILPSTAEALEFGTDTLKQYSGIIDIGIFTPRDIGSAVARGYADTLVSLFDMETFGSVECDEASAQNLGIDGNWYHVSVTIPYKRRET